MLVLLTLSGAKAQVLQNFSERLDELWNDRSESLKMAVDAYKDLVEQGDVQTADSAYVLLEDFAVLLTKNIDFNLILLRSGNKDRNSREKKAAADYAALLYGHYFSVVHRNGLINIRPDLMRIQTELKDFLSPRTYAYFEAVQQDTNAFGQTEIVEFTPMELAERACFWDGFLSDTAYFLFRDEAEQRRDAYIEQLVFGTEKQPVFENGKASEAYLKAYRKTQACAGGKTKTVAGDYLKLLKENDYRDCPAVWMFSY
ncbi:MAG: hypothetical protein NC396_03160 [Bacteroides sp.]|nr:hypothetical protein [Bacteroides sp.]MCM1085169.1 hypothetical protein [Bacteroides sp.]